MQPQRKISGMVAVASLLAAPTAFSAQQDVTAPPGAGGFGNYVWVLPNGNIVTTANYFESADGTAAVGAVYLYSPDGQMISRLTGSTTGDLNNSGVTVLPNGDFVVSSPEWNNGSATKAGATTWVNGTTGLNGSISPTNSLVGTHAEDRVGYDVTVLANGNYVVSSSSWDNDAVVNAGAITWASGDGTGPFGPVSPANSLVGTTDGDLVAGSIGSVTVLPNGNYVVCSRNWSNGQATNAGAVTWQDGYQAMPGAVSSSNSMVGTSANDRVCSSGVTVVGNSNYVVASADWHDGTNRVGATTWAAGDQPFMGVVTTTNSFVGSTATAFNATIRVIALSDGNYVVASPFWGLTQNDNRGAVTWADGQLGLTGPISAANSLTGVQPTDTIGVTGVVPLTNGSYVVVSPNWSDSESGGSGAVTWVAGGATNTQVVSIENSLVGPNENPCNRLAAVALTNGNFVVQCSAPAIYGNGSVTWGSGTVGLSGPVSPTRSLMVANAAWVVALSNGNYSVASISPVANTTKIGSVTWGNGSSGTFGTVSAANSLLLSDAGDYIDSLSLTAVGNGNYVVANPFKDVNGILDAGTVTWLDGSGPTTGVVSTANSLVGSSNRDRIGYGDTGVLANGDYVVSSIVYRNAAANQSGAVTLGRGNSPIIGIIDGSNSVRLTSTESYGYPLFFSHDAQRDRLVVGQPYARRFSIFRLDALFSNGF